MSSITVLQSAKKLSERQKEMVEFLQETLEQVRNDEVDALMVFVLPRDETEPYNTYTRFDDRIRALGALSLIRDTVEKA